MLCFKGVLHTASRMGLTGVLQVDSRSLSGRGFTVAFDPYVLTLCVYAAPFALFAIERIPGVGLTGCGVVNTWVLQ